MADVKKGTVGIVWKMATKKLVEGRPAQRICTVASTSGPAAKEPRIRCGDKLVAFFCTPSPAASAEGSHEESPKAGRTKRICVVEFDVVKVRQVLQGKAGEAIVLEFLRAGECCPSEEAMLSANFGKSRNTFSVRLVREQIIDYRGVERSATVGVKPVEDLVAERKLHDALDKAYMRQSAMIEAKNKRHEMRFQAKVARQEQLFKHEEQLRSQVEESKRQEFQSRLAKAREKVDAKQALVEAQAKALLSVLRSPPATMSSRMLENTEELDLNNLGLTVLPPYLRSMSVLTSLHLSNNRISVLPYWLGELCKLEVLAFSNNRLRELPTGMSKLRNLRHIDLRLNPSFHTPPLNVIEKCSDSTIHTGFIDPEPILTYLRLCHNCNDDQDAEEDAEEAEEEIEEESKGSNNVRQIQEHNEESPSIQDEQVKISKREWEYQKSCSLVFLGDAGSGKTACLQHLVKPEDAKVLCKTPPNDFCCW
jgi:flagellar biosynthesis GTPase FlhF